MGLCFLSDVPCSCPLWFFALMERWQAWLWNEGGLGCCQPTGPLCKLEKGLLSPQQPQPCRCAAYWADWQKGSMPLLLSAKSPSAEQVPNIHEVLGVTQPNDFLSVILHKPLISIWLHSAVTLTSMASITSEAEIPGWISRLVDMSLCSCGYEAEAQQAEMDHTLWFSSLIFLICFTLSNLLSLSESQVPYPWNWERKTHLTVVQRGTSRALYVKSLAWGLEKKSLSKMAAALTLLHVHLKEHLLMDKLPKISKVFPLLNLLP